MLKRIIRSVFKRYGYNFLKTENLYDIGNTNYASISVVNEMDGEGRILFMYMADEVSRTHILSVKNVKEIMISCEEILNYQD